MRKNKKATKKNRKPRILQKTNADYENEVTELNKILAEVSLEAEIAQNGKDDCQDELDKKREDFRDIQEYLNYQVESHEAEIAKQENQIKEITEKLELQHARHIQILEAQEKEAKEIQDKLSEELYETETTIIILKPFQHRREQYLLEEQSLTEQEQRQKEKHTQELHDEEKNLRQAETPLKKELNQQLATLQAPLVSLLLPENQEIIINRINNNSKELSAAMATLGQEYYLLKQKESQLSDKLKEAELEVHVERGLQTALRKMTFTNGRKELKKIKEKNMGKVAIEKIEKTKSPELKKEVSGTNNNEVEDKLTQTEEIIQPERELITHIYDMICEELKVDQRQWNSESDEASVKKEINDDEWQEIRYEERRQLIKELLDNVQQCLTEEKGAKEKGKGQTKPRTPRIKHKHEALQRPQLYRNWRLPRSLELQKIKNNAHIPLSDPN